jgi:hypothetical protein
MDRPNPVNIVAENNAALDEIREDVESILRHHEGIDINERRRILWYAAAALVLFGLTGVASSYAMYCTLGAVLFGLVTLRAVFHATQPSPMYVTRATKLLADVTTYTREGPPILPATRDRLTQDLQRVKALQTTYYFSRLCT